MKYFFISYMAMNPYGRFVPKNKLIDTHPLSLEWMDETNCILASWQKITESEYNMHNEEF